MIKLWGLKTQKPSFVFPLHLIKNRMTCKHPDFCKCVCMCILLVLEWSLAAQVYVWLLILSGILLCLQLHADEPLWGAQAEWRWGAADRAGQEEETSQSNNTHTHTTLNLFFHAPLSPFDLIRFDRFFGVFFYENASNKMMAGGQDTCVHTYNCLFI